MSPLVVLVSIWTQPSPWDLGAFLLSLLDFLRLLYASLILSWDSLEILGWLVFFLATIFLTVVLVAFLPAVFLLVSFFLVLEASSFLP